MKNILIVDRDLGFIYWLGDVLIHADYQPWPACSVSDAFAVVGRKPIVPLDLLIVNPRLPLQLRPHSPSCPAPGGQTPLGT